jgi:hypothetical protein
VFGQAERTVIDTAGVTVNRINRRLKEPNFELTKSSTGKVQSSEEQLTSNRDNNKQQINKKSS